MATGNIYPTEHVGFSSIPLTKAVTCSRCITLLILHISDSLLIEIVQWNITPSYIKSLFYIRPASDTTVGFSQSLYDKEKYWGYGFAQGWVGPSADWRFTKSSDGKSSRYSSSEFVV